MIVRDAATGKRGERFKVRARFPHIATPWTMAFWRGGSVLAVGTTNGKVELWDMSEWVRRRPERVEVVSGLGQRGVAGASLPAPFEVSVRDENGDPFPGIPVIFDVTGGGGALSRTAARADTAGNAATTLTLGPESGGSDRGGAGSGPGAGGVYGHRIRQPRPERRRAGGFQ